MDYLGDKMNSFTSGALSAINEIQRKKQSKSNKTKQQSDNSIGNRQQVLSMETSASINQTSGQQPTLNRLAPLRAAPFGGDSNAFQRPPPIGFKTNLLELRETTNRLHESQLDPVQAPESEPIDGDSPSQQSDSWNRLWFQRVMILSLIRMLLFIRKVYEDFQATKAYGSANKKGHFVLAALSLLLPTIVFSVYRISRYLQLTLPLVRLERSATDQDQQVSKIGQDDEEAKLRQALVGKEQITKREQTNNDTTSAARRSPSDADEYHDSTSQQDQAISPSPAPSTALVKSSQTSQALQVMSPNISYDSEGSPYYKNQTRIVIGASEQLLHGVLFIFWQLKRQVDVLGYLVDRSCQWRKPSESEKTEIDRLKTGSDGLEWFQDFYAAFLAILVQVYTLGSYLASGQEKGELSLGTASAALGGLLGADTPDSPISNAGRALGNFVTQSAKSNGAESKDMLIISELVVSSAVIFSLLLAVKRRDDGPLTLGLSMIGWGSLFAARIIIISLAFVHIGWKIMLSSIVLHIIFVTLWIYRISLDSHNGKPGESDEYKWMADSEQGEQITLNDAKTKGATYSVTSQWSISEHLTLLAQIVALFSVPSLFYWPIMFNLKRHYRTFKYLVLILTENFILVPVIWYIISPQASTGQWYLLCAVGALSIVGFIFITLYVACKPSLTEYFARADELFNEAESSGIYYEFCSRVFKMPDLSDQLFRRLMNQSEKIEEEIEINLDRQ